MKTVHLDVVQNAAIREVDDVLALVKDLQTFSGTMKVRQLTWTKERKRDVLFNTLSCFSCEPGSVCSHFGMGKPWVLLSPRPRK